MKLTIKIIFVFLTFLFPLIAQPVAPWIPLSPDAPEDISGRNGPAPYVSEVNIPIYPGSYLTSVFPVNESNLSETSPLPTIYLVTSDEIRKVAEFYKERLSEEEGWMRSREYLTFVKGNLSEAFARTVPGVALREETGESYDLKGADPKIVASLKTRIKIAYLPMGK